MSVSDTNGRRKTYGNYRKPSKTEDVKPKLDGILTWKVPGIKIDVRYQIFIFRFSEKLKSFAISSKSFH